MQPGKLRAGLCLFVFAMVLLAVYLLQDFDMILVGALSIFAGIGVFAVLAYASGLFSFTAETDEVAILAAYADHLSDGMLITKKRGDVVYANDAYFHILKRERSRVIPTIENYFSGDPSIAEQLYRLSQAANQLRNWEEEIYVKDSLDKEQSPRWLRISVRPIYAKAQTSKISGVVWRIGDITLERGQREREYHDLTSAIQHFDQAPAGYFTFNQSGQITYMNATLARWLGREDRYSESLSLDMLLSQEGVQLLQQSLTPHSLLRDVQYYDLLCADGSTMSVILYGRPNGTVASDDDVEGDQQQSQEQSYGVIALSADDAPLLFEPQRMTEMRLEQFYHSAPIGIATINGQGIISNANGSFRALLGQGGASGSNSDNLLELIADEKKTDLKSALELAGAGNAVIAPVDVEFILGEKNSGRLFLSTARDMAEDGAVAIVYAIDTTKQRALEEQFAQSQKMQAVGQLAGGIAHDFNNVLTAIIGFSDLLIGSHRPTDPAFKDIMNIKQNANRAASLVRHLLAFSRQQTLRPEVLSLNHVIKDVSAMLARLLGENVELKVVHGRDLWAVQADHHQFDQVIINLAVNARDAMPEGGTVTIKTENITERQSLDLAEEKQGLVPGEYVLLEISDTGTGMSPEIMTKIFEPFFTTKDVGQGTGLGLSMVYGIIKQTDGFIYVDSEAGEGTSFKIYLPRHEEQEHMQVEERQAQIERPKDLTGSETVLLVEDEEAVRSFAARALSTRGYHVLEAASGVDALELVENHGGGIDLVISDVMMPEMDGPTMLSHLRESLPDVKVIFISGYAEDAFEKNLDAGESFSFLPKPFSLKQLAATVKDVLAT